MASTTHYMDIMPVVGSTAREVFSRLFSASHRMIAEGLDLAVTWPDMTEGGLGERMRVFGEEHAISELRSRTEALSAAGLAVMGRIKVTPEAIGWRVFARDRSMEKVTSKFIEGENRRREKRGFPPCSRKPRNEGSKNVVGIHSSTTGQHYFVFVKAIDVQMDDPYVTRGGASYGLGHPTPVF